MTEKVVIIGGGASGPKTAAKLRRENTNIEIDLYTQEEIMLYIDRYAQAYFDKSYYFDYAWTLESFLTRKKGISYFEDSGEKWLNYLKEQKKITPNRNANINNNSGGINVGGKGTSILNLHLPKNEEEY